MKKLSLLLALFMMVSMIAGCASKKVTTPEVKEDQTTSEASETTTEATTEASKETIEVTLLSRWSDDQPRSVLFKQRIDEFNAQNNGIKIVAEHINDEAAYLDKLRTSFATGDQPNIFFGYGGSREYEYAKNGVVMNLDPVFEANPEWYASFKPSFDKWQYKDIEGTFGAPVESYAITLYYNKKIFNELGLTPPSTITDFEKVSDTLLEKGLIPMALGAKDVWRVGHVFNNFFMKSYGSQGVAQLADRSMAYDSKEVIDILTRIQTYNTKGYFGENAVSVDYNNEKTMFFEGKTAMHMDGSWFLGEAAASAIAEDIGVISFPYINEAFKDSWFGSGAGFSVTTNSDKAVEEASVVVLKYLTDKQFFLDDLAGSKGGIYPVEFTEADIKDIEISSVSKAFIDALSSAKEFRDDIQTYDSLPSMLDTCRIAFQGLFAGMSPEECAKEIVTEISSR
ncbi:MAG: extracellular solute-binding protein [Vallitaleaceae bacterium]|nr:extracellular solute-binding protein [Vallitaleaceae bacterium]